MAAAGWLRGTVKSVESADTLTIVGAVKPGGGPPPEKRLTLSSLIAPKLVGEAFSGQSC
jgi:staphylococcal nuclease domain-containing protein 1